MVHELTYTVAHSSRSRMKWALHQTCFSTQGFLQQAPHHHFVVSAARCGRSNTIGQSIDAMANLRTGLNQKVRGPSKNTTLTSMVCSFDDKHQSHREPPASLFYLSNECFVSWIHHGHERYPRAPKKNGEVPNKFSLDGGDVAPLTRFRRKRWRASSKHTSLLKYNNNFELFFDELLLWLIFWTFKSPYRGNYFFN